MKRTVAALLPLVSACSINYPQNAEEFRQQIPGAFMGGVQSFEAKRPFRDVARTFQAKAPECLNAKVRVSSQTGTSVSNILYTYKPTVKVTDRKAEVHVQRHMDGNVIVPGKEPPGGLYFVVADATPLDKTRTKIDIYGPTRGADALVRAITGWATGENVGCPDLTKN